MYSIKLLDHIIFKTHNFQNCFKEFWYTESFLESFVSWTIGMMLLQDKSFERIVLLSLTASFLFLSKIKYGATLTKIYGEEISATTFVLIGRPNWLALHFLPALFIWSKERLAQSAEWTALVFILLSTKVKRALMEAWVKR